MSSFNSNANYETVLELCINSLMSQVRNYTEDQLQSLLNDEDRLNAMVDSMPQISSLITDKELKLAQSKSFAEYNLSMEPKLREGCSRLESTHNTVVQTKQEVEMLKARLDSIAEDRSLDSVSAVLQAAAQEAEDQSEATAEKFQNGSIDVDEFLKEFNEKRILAHMRKIKSEKLLEILRQQQYNTASNIVNPHVNPQQNPYHFQNRNSQFLPQSNSRHSYFQ